MDFILQFIERRRVGELIRRDVAVQLVRDELNISNKEAETKVKALESVNRVEGHAWNTVFVKVEDLKNLLSSVIEAVVEKVEEVVEEVVGTVKKTVKKVSQLLLPAPKESKYVPYDSIVFLNCKTPEEVKALYKRLSKIYHPDKGGRAEDFKQLKKDYEQMLIWVSDNLKF